MGAVMETLARLLDTVAARHRGKPPIVYGNCGRLRGRTGTVVLRAPGWPGGAERLAVVVLGR